MTGAAFYDAADACQPLALDALAATLDRCLFCDGEVAVVGAFVPNDDVQAQRAVHRLRRHALPDGMVPALAYGLCAAHWPDDETADAVEARLAALAAQVVLQ